MVFVTGDLHGEWERFRARGMRQLHRGDTLLVCGDFGFLWDGSKRERALLRKIEGLPFTVAFVDGCHENYDLLLALPVEEWNGAPVHRVGKNIVHLMRGEVYTIEEHTYFAFGGGHSGDLEFRDEPNSWWEQERPNREEIQHGMDTLQAWDNKIDYIITHEPPALLKDCLGVPDSEHVEVHRFFEDIVKACIYRKWFFGKCHLNKYIPVKFYAVFDAVLPVTVRNTDMGSD
jgi:hypothetical protein